MGNFDDAKPKSAEQLLINCIDRLEDYKHAMACFVGAFETYASRLLKEIKNETR